MKSVFLALIYFALIFSIRKACQVVHNRILCKNLASTIDFSRKILVQLLIWVHHEVWLGWELRNEWHSLFLSIVNYISPCFSSIRGNCCKVCIFMISSIYSLWIWNKVFQWNLDFINFFSKIFIFLIKISIKIIFYLFGLLFQRNIWRV